MINRLATRISRLALYLMTLIGLAACGGGGGGGGDDGGFLGPDVGGDNDTLFLNIALVDSDGNPTNSITTANPATLEATVTRNGRNGAPQSDVIVNVNADVEVLINGLTDGSESITDAEGRADFRIEASQARGAGTITVSVVDESGTEVVETVNFQLGATGLRLGYMDGRVFIEGQIRITPEGTVSARGQAELSVAIVDEDGEPVESAEAVNFRSACLTSGDSTLDPANPVPTSTGSVTAMYMPSGCTGTDSITAELVGSSATASGVIEIASPSANSLGFQSAEPNLIVLKGTGGGGSRVEQSTVTFITTDANGQPLPDVEVQFSLTTDVGGITLDPVSAISDSEGLVQTVVSSGNVATVVRVLATAPSADGTSEVSAVSDLLTVSTGLPDQNSISVGVVEGFVAPNAMNVDGVTRTIVVRMADKFNNPVPDGTSALFTTEYGSIQSSCETADGACEVTWTSQAPRLPTLSANQALVQGLAGNPLNDCPAHNGPSIPCPADLGVIRGGRSEILVTAIGEESFIDRNGNGIYDQAEASDGLFANLTEAFIDHNENGFFDPATQACTNTAPTDECRAGSEETFVDFDNDQSFDVNGDNINNGYPDAGQIARYNGLLCPEEGDGVWCSRELVNVFASTVVILSNGPNWRMELYRNSTHFPGGSTVTPDTFTVYVSDTFNNMPPAGSTVAISAEGACEISGQDSFEVLNTARVGAFGASFVQAGSIPYDPNAPTVPDDTGELTISLQPTDGPEFSRTWPCQADLVATP